jgi:hypothetical protein
MQDFWIKEVYLINYASGLWIIIYELLQKLEGTNEKYIYNFLV